MLHHDIEHYSDPPVTSIEALMVCIDVLEGALKGSREVQG